MALIVQKYGGSSVATPERIKKVAEKVAAASRLGSKVVVVVSAMGDTTDGLLSLARQITTRPSDREMDMLLSTGEQVSIALLAMALHALGIEAVSLTGGQAGISTDGVHRKARIIQVEPARILTELDKGKIVIVAGFQGVNPEDDIATLGRGGSDTTAVALAAALQADSCEIYTDVDGVYTADPRVVPDARKIDRISYDEMLEMAGLGAQVMQLRSVEYGKTHGVMIHVRSSFTGRPGTIIAEVGEVSPNNPVRGVAHDTKIAKVSLAGVPDRPGIAHQVFAALAKHSVNVDMIIQGYTSEGTADISFTIHEDDLDHAEPVVREQAELLGVKGVAFDPGAAKVSIVGAGIASNAGVAARMFEALAEEDINIEMITCSEIKISCVIRASEVQRAVRAIHSKFKLSEEVEAAV